MKFRSHPTSTAVVRRLIRSIGFTVVELLVAVSIMTVIVLALYGMFDQTQRALRSNVAQVDVLEGGRAAMEMISRELSQAQASGVLSNKNFFLALNQPPRRMPLVVTNEWRTNATQQLYFLSKSNKTWLVLSYRVLPSTNLLSGIPGSTEGVGSLARFTIGATDDAISALDPFLAIMNPNVVPDTNYARILEGVVHFKVRAYDSFGDPMIHQVYLTNAFRYTNSWLEPDPRDATSTLCVTTNTTLPAFVEVELGLLEPQAAERWKSMPTPLARSNYLARQAGRVHLFRERIPLRAAPFLRLPTPP